MRTITKSVINLSEIPEELHKYIETEFEMKFHLHTYLEAHIDGDEHDDLSLWLLDNYPTLKRKISFLIHIDI